MDNINNQEFERVVNPNPAPIVRKFTLQEVMMKLSMLQRQQELLTTKIEEAQADLQVILDNQ